MWKKKSKGLGDRGKEAEKIVQEFLERWAAGSPHREANRLVDSRAARRIIAPAKADFDFYAGFGADAAFFGLLEVKETEHEFRLARAKLPQLPNLRKRELCGGICGVLVRHSTLGPDQWRYVTAEWLSSNGDKGSWNLSAFPLYEAPGVALHHSYSGIF